MKTIIERIGLPALLEQTAEESGMNISEYAEYISSKADECRARLEVNLNEV